MSKKTFKEGDVFGNWVVIEPYINGLKGKALCNCTLCNKRHKVRRCHLRSGNSTKCVDCYSKKMKVEPCNKTHGMTGTQVYEAWKSLRKRVYNSQGRDYKNYKQRGIGCCERWLKFENFYEDMGAIPKDGKRYSIGRIDNDGDYCKENCRWENDIQQASNTTRTRWITFRGKTQSMADWARELDISYYKIRSRLNQYGWSVEDALTK